MKNKQMLFLLFIVILLICFVNIRLLTVNMKLLTVNINTVEEITRQNILNKKLIQKMNKEINKLEVELMYDAIRYKMVYDFYITCTNWKYSNIEDVEDHK